MDLSLRKNYGIPSGTVQSVNSLRGAALVGGTLLALRLREEFPELPITESHPKALLIAFKLESDAAIEKCLHVRKAWHDEHQRDAMVAAVCAREGFEGRWRCDLAKHRHRLEQDPKSFCLAPVSYWWPEQIGRGHCDQRDS